MGRMRLTLHSSWGWGLNLGAQQTAESGESLSQALARFGGFSQQGNCAPLPPSGRGPGRDEAWVTQLIHPGGKLPASLTRIPQTLRGNLRASSPETH